MSRDPVPVPVPVLEIWVLRVDLGAELGRRMMERAGVREWLTLLDVGWLSEVFMHTGQGSISGSEGTADHIPG